MFITLHGWIQVQRTTDNITDLGRRSWRQARRTGSKMQPKNIMRMFDRAGRPANFEDAGVARSPSDGGHDLEDPLLRRHSDSAAHDLSHGQGLPPSGHDPLQPEQPHSMPPR